MSAVVYSTTNPARDAVYCEPDDDLTPEELERGIDLLRRLKRGDVALVIAQKVRGSLYIKAAPRLT